MKEVWEVPYIEDESDDMERDVFDDLEEEKHHKRKKTAPDRDILTPTLNVREKKARKISTFRLLNPKALKTEIHRCGYEFSVGKYLKFLLMCYFALIVFLFFFKLHLKFIIAIVLVVTVFLPSVFIFNFWNVHEQKKFEEITSYMEQLLYSFKRQPKILNALQDTVLLFQDEENQTLRIAIEKAIDHIKNGTATRNIYEEAFAFIEEEYGCKRLYKIHNFLIKVEGNGGVCNNSIDILLLDRNLWIDRIYDLIALKQKIRVNVSGAIALSFIISCFAIYMIPSDFGVTDHIVSQVVTSIVVLLNFLIWYIVQKLLSHSLLAADADDPFSTIKRSYDLIMHGDRRSVITKYRIMGIAFAAMTVAIYFLTKNTMVTVAMGVFTVLILTQGGRKWKACRKRVIKEVEKAFPEWLLMLALQMQTDNLHVSISKTIDDAPEILKEELIRLQDSIEKHPRDLEPFTNFFHDFYISDITSAMKMLYSMAEFGAEDAQEQIKTLVERNTKMMDKAEKIRIDDELAGITFSMLLPMITGAFKLVTDLGLVMLFVLSQLDI